MKSEFLHAPFSIHISLSYFTVMSNETLKELDFFFAYLDNIIIYSNTEKEYLIILGKCLTTYTW